MAPGTVGAKPYLAFRLDRVLAAADLRSVEGRARAAAAGVDVLRDHPNELVRDAYLMKLADLCRVDAEQLRASSGARPAAGATGRSSGVATPSRAAASGAGHPAELEALILLVHRRDEMAAVARRRPVRRRPPPGRVLGAAGRARRRRGPGAPAATDPGAAEVLAEVAVADSEAEPDDVGALPRSSAAAERRLRELEAETRVAEDPLALQRRGRRLTLGIEGLREPATGRRGR